MLSKLSRPRALSTLALPSFFGQFFDHRGLPTLEAVQRAAQDPELAAWLAINKLHRIAATEFDGGNHNPYGRIGCEKFEAQLRRNTPIDSRDRNGNTALLIATNFGNWNAYLSALDNGANPGARNVNGVTPLILATTLDNERMFGPLVDRLAATPSKEGLNAVTINGDSAVQIAARNGKTQMVTELLRSGASATLRKKGDALPVITALAHGHIETALIFAQSNRESFDAFKKHQTQVDKAADRLHGSGVKKIEPRGRN